MNTIKTKIDGEVFSVWSPYDGAFVKRARETGGKWNGECWQFNVVFIEAVREAMRETYCYDDTEEPELVNVQVTFGDHIGWADRGGVEMFGKTLARAYGNSTGAKVGADVVLVSGEIYSGGSKKNWGTGIQSRSVFQICNVVKKRYEKEKGAWEQDGCSFTTF